MERIKNTFKEVIVGIDSEISLAYKQKRFNDAIVFKIHREQFIKDKEKNYENEEFLKELILYKINNL